MIAFRETVPASPVVLRLEVPDRPGSLSVVAGVLGARGVNILRLEVVGRADGVAVDDLLLEGGDLDGALAELGPLVRVVARESQADLPDPGIAMAEACARVAESPSLALARQELLRAAIDLARAAHGVLLRNAGHGWLRPVAATVERLRPIPAGEPSHVRDVLATRGVQALPAGSAWAPADYLDRLGRGATALVAGGSPPQVVAVVRESESPFAGAELARLHGMVRVTQAVLAALDVRALLQPEPLQSAVESS